MIRSLEIACRWGTSDRKGPERRIDRRGFSLVELAVVVIIIGVLAAFGVPRFRDAVERSKAAEAVSYLSAIRSAQERYQAKQGTYATKVGGLDIQMTTPKYFKDNAAGAINDNTAITVATTAKSPSWTLLLRRDAGTSSYGDYTVIFTDGGLSSTSTIVSDTDLNTRINPIGQ